MNTHRHPTEGRGGPRFIILLSLASLVLFLAGTGAVSAQTPTNTPTLSLHAAVDQAYRENPELLSLRARWLAMRERPAQAGALPNPMFTYSGMDPADSGSWPDTAEKRYMVQQEFPSPGKRGLREGIASKDAEVLQRELDTMTLEVVMRVKETYLDLAAIQQVIALTEKEGEVVRRLEKTAETLYATGERSQADVLKAQAEITLLKQKSLELKAQENTLQAKLNTLLNRRPDAPLAVVVPPTEPAFQRLDDTLFALAATNRPEIQAAQAEIDRHALEQTLMAKDSVPDYTLGLEYREIGKAEDMVMFTVSVDLPIWRSKIRGGVREADALRTASQNAREAAERQCAFDVQDAAFKLTTAQRTLALTRTELLPQAEARFNASETGYRTGKVDFTDLLESERFLLSVKTMIAMTEGTVGIQAARMERAVGTPPAVSPDPQGKE